jgi:hypothetical protein
VNTNLKGNVLFEKGHLYWEYKVANAGDQTLTGEIKINRNGEAYKYQIKDSFKGINPDFAISLNNINYLLKRKENPISVCVSGMAGFDIEAFALNASKMEKLDKQPGNYIVIPNSDKDVIINVAGKFGSHYSMIGTRTFHVK